MTATVTAAPGAPPSEQEPAALRLTWRQVTALATALAAAGIATRMWVAVQGYFVIDDYIFLLQASVHPLASTDYLLRPHFGHVMPGGHALTWLVNWIAPLSFPAFVGASVAMQVAVAAMAWRFLVLVFGRSPWLLVPFAVYAVTPLTLPSYVWWSAAVNALPLQIAMLASASAFVHWLREGRRRQAAFTVVWTLVGLLFFEKALLIPLVLLGLGLVLSPERNPLRAAWVLVRRSWALWSALAVLCGAYVVAYRSLVERFGARPDIDYVREVLRQGLSEAVIPSMVGGPWRWFPDFLTPAAAPPDVLQWVATVVVGGLVLLSCRRQPARRAWAVLLLYVLVQLGLLVAGRSAFASIISLQYRYYADAALLVALAVGCSVVPGFTSAGLPGEPRSGDRSSTDAVIPRRPARLAAVVAAALSVNLVVVGSLQSAAGFADLWQVNPTRAYVETARQSLQDHPDAVVLTTPVRIDVVNGFFEDRLAAQLFHRMPHRAGFSASPTSLVLLDDEGLLRHGDVAGVTTQDGPEVGCGWRIPPGRDVAVPMRIPVYRWYFTLGLRYAATAPTRVRVALDGPARSWRLDPAHSVRYLPVSGGGGVLHVTNLGTVPLCVRSAVVGLAVPTGGEL